MRKIFLITFLISTFGCVDSKMDVRSPDSEKNAPSPNQQTCYLVDDSCLNTVESSQIVDQNNEFQYKNPEDFPKEALRPQYQKPLRFIDLTNANSVMPISPNFILGEFASIAKGRYAILQRHMISAVQNIRDQLGASLRINSGYRSPAYNSKLDGAASWSRHTYGDAADMVSNNATLNKLKELCLDQGSDFYQIYTKHIHCDWRKTKLDSAFYDSKNSELPTNIELNSINAKVVPLAIRDNLLQLSVSDFEQEDEGELIYSWHVTLPDGQTLDYDNANIALPRMPGTYHTEVTIGGSTVIRQEFIWSE